MRIGDCEIRIEDCGIRIEDCGIRIEDYGIGIEDCGIRIKDYRGSSANSKCYFNFLPISYEFRNTFLDGYGSLCLLVRSLEGVNISL